MQEHEPSFRPLAGAPARRSDRWYIVAGHGLFVAYMTFTNTDPTTLNYNP